jgi:Nucleotidyltransferase domain
MDKQQVLSLLDAHRDRLDEFAVKALFLFGSVARDEATAESDVDFLVEFNRPVEVISRRVVGLFSRCGNAEFFAPSSSRNGVERGDPCRLESLLCVCRICWLRLPSWRKPSKT